MDKSDIPFEDTRPHVYTVSDLTEKIKELLEEHFDFIWVEAEISNFRSPLSGHYYMVLKDESAQIRAVMFRPQIRYLRFTPEDGMKVIARGRISVYQPRGEYQVILDYIEPLGVGAMALAFEQLKKKLAAKGIFDEDKKKPLPFLPQRVAVITSPTGAAIRDFLQIIHRRFANIEIILIPVRVQGDGAASEMVEALKIAERELEVDIIVLTRGGGSMEDLWAFNDENLAMAISSCPIPVVSAVGHEIDITISDLAADLRAPTPSAAAELIVSEKESLIKSLDNSREHLKSLFSTRIFSLRQSLQVLVKGLRDPRKDIADSWLHLDDIQERLIRMINFIIGDKRKTISMEIRTLMLYSPFNRIASFKDTIELRKELLYHMIFKGIKDKRMAISLYGQKITDLSPFSALSRGYTITRKLPEKTVIRSIIGLHRGDKINILFSDGQLDCLIDDMKEG